MAGGPSQGWLQERLNLSGGVGASSVMVGR